MGILQYPIAKVSLTAPFGPYTVAGVRKPHNGCDICSQLPGNVVAAHDGTVLFSIYDSGGGNMVAIKGKYNDKLDVITRYAHLASRSVSAGQTVARGQQIGVEGATGNQCYGKHLHFEVWLVPRGYVYRFADRPKYTVDPLSVCHLVDGQSYVRDTDTFGLGAVPYPEVTPPALETLTDGRLTVADGGVRVRLTPSTDTVPLTGDPADRSRDTLGEWCSAREFVARQRCTTTGTDGKEQVWALIDTDMGPWWVAVVPGYTTLVSGQSTPAPAPAVPAATSQQLMLDVSEHQTAIDWARVKAAGIGRVVLRWGFRGYGSGKVVQDSSVDGHYAGAHAAGLPVDLYFFTQAINEPEAVEEANACLTWAKSREIGRIYIDIETANAGSGRADGNSKAAWTSIARAFCSACRAGGHAAGVYANLSYMSSKLDTAALRADGCLLWVAHYTDAAHPEYATQYDAWQYVSTGTVDGISGGVDLSHLYSIASSVPAADSTPTTSTLRIGPASAGDVAAIRAKASELQLTYSTSDDGIVTVGPMSAGDRATLTALAQSLYLPVEAAKADAAPVTPPASDDNAEGKEIEQLRAQLADLTAKLTAAEAATAARDKVIAAIKAAIA